MSRGGELFMRENREIKFRALDHMNKWQYGYYRFIKNSPVNGKEINQHTIHNGSYEELIRPETIGQYTGLKDSTRTKEFPEGKEIYEGDFLKVVSLSNDHNQIGAINVMNVFYFMGAFCLRFRNEETGQPIYPLNVNHVIEVIGNINEVPK